MCTIIIGNKVRYWWCDTVKRDVCWSELAPF